MRTTSVFGAVYSRIASQPFSRPMPDGCLVEPAQERARRNERGALDAWGSDGGGRFDARTRVTQSAAASFVWEMFLFLRRGRGESGHTAGYHSFSGDVAGGGARERPCLTGEIIIIIRDIM